MPVSVRAFAAALVWLATLATVPAFAQGTLSTRILQIEDARQLTTEAQAVLTEGLKDASPRVRAQAVRAMGRFESPALVLQIVPLLSDADPGVRHAAAVAAANAAKVFPLQAIEALIKAMGTAPPADWAVLAASLGRITLPGAADFTAAEQAMASGLPAVVLRAQVMRPARPAIQPTDPARVEGAARGLEALVRVNGKLGTLSADTRSRLFGVVETSQGPSARGLARARRLALLALRNARAVDGDLALTAAKDPDDEVRRLAMTAAAAAVAAEGAAIPETDREAALRIGLKDAEPRVRLEALRGWGRHFQAKDCQPILAAAADANTHVALQAIDLLGAGCATGSPVVAMLQKEATALPAHGAAWHRAAHAVVSLARTAPVETRPLLPRFVGHPTWQVRMYAARAAGQTTEIETLVRLGNDDHDNVREAALEELARLKRPEALTAAYAALGRPDYQLRDDRGTGARGRDRQAQSHRGAADRVGRSDRTRPRHVPRPACGHPRRP